MGAEWNHGDNPHVEGDDAEDDAMIAPDEVLEEIVFDDEGMPIDDDDDDGEVDEAAVDELTQRLRAAIENEAGRADGDDDDDDAYDDVPNDSIASFMEHTSSVYSVAIDPTGKLAATGGGDDKAYVWNLLTGECLLTIEKHTDSVAALAFNVDGKHLATGGMEGQVFVWDMTTMSKEPLASMDGPDEIRWLEYHPRGNIIIAGANDGTVWMWMDAGKVMQVFSGHTAPVESGCFTPDGKHILTVSEDNMMILWDPKTGKPVHRISSQTDGRFHDGPLTSVAVSADSSVCMSGSEDDKVVVYHLQQGKLLNVLTHHEGAVEALGYSPAHPFAASGGMDGKAFVYDTPSMRVRHKLAHEDSVIRTLWHPTQPLLITASVDRKIRVWDARTGKCTKTFQAHTDAILDAVISKDGRYVLSAGDDMCAFVFEI